MSSLYISKHLMLLFIKDYSIMVHHQYEFQNILCYCLSAKVLGCSKTHFGFQNILCYCLSPLQMNGCYQTKEFQNILCYCLSSIFITSLIFLFISKHLMLLFIYISGTDSASFVNFKTSYVIVYPLLFLCSYFRTLHFKTSYVIVYHSRQLGKVF